jgi:hypothetical protein
LVEYSKNKFAWELMDGQLHDDRYKIIGDLIYYKGRIYLVPKSFFKKKMLQAFHNSSLAGHQGFLNAYIQIREIFSRKGLKEDFMHHIRECVTCQQNKDENTHPTSLFHPLPIIEHKWESVSMGFIT